MPIQGVCDRCNRTTWLHTVSNSSYYSANLCAHCLHETLRDTILPHTSIPEESVADDFQQCVVECEELYNKVQSPPDEAMTREQITAIHTKMAQSFIPQPDINKFDFIMEAT